MSDGLIHHEMVCQTDELKRIATALEGIRAALQTVVTMPAFLPWAAESEGTILRHRLSNATFVGLLGADTLAMALNTPRVDGEVWRAENPAPARMRWGLVQEINGREVYLWLTPGPYGATELCRLANERPLKA